MIAPQRSPQNWSAAAPIGPRRDSGARRDGALEQRVAIVDVEPQRDRRAAERLRAPAAPHLVVEHDDRIADADLGMHDLAVRSWRPRQYFGAERLRVPVERAGRIVHDEVRRYRVVSGGNAAFRFCHVLPPPLRPAYLTLRSRHGWRLGRKSTRGPHRVEKRAIVDLESATIEAGRRR